MTYGVDEGMLWLGCRVGLEWIGLVKTVNCKICVCIFFGVTGFRVFCLGHTASGGYSLPNLQPEYHISKRAQDLHDNIISKKSCSFIYGLYRKTIHRS